MLPSRAWEDPTLADAIRNLPLDIPQTTTGQQALDFLLDVWNKKPSSVEALRGRLAAAYRYVLDDLESGLIPDDDWQKARAHAQLYGGRKWHPVGPGLAVDDVGSPLIHQFLPEQRVTVAAAHLGETNDEVRRVANALGLRLLSADVSVEPGTPTASPRWAGQLRWLLETLAGLEDRRSLQEVAFHAALRLRISSQTNTIHAYVKDATLTLAGEPRTFGVEAAGQLVEYFRLGQRGNVIPWLTGALFSLGNEQQFEHALQVLADGLGVDPFESRAAEDDELSQREPIDGPAVGPRKTPGDVPGPNAPPGPGAEKRPASPDVEPGPRNTPGSDHPANPEIEGGSQNVPPVKPPPQPPRAADHFGIVVARRRKEERNPINTGPDRGGTVRDDHKARQAVILYETHYDRRAEAMDDHQPGFDIRSIDNVTGHERRIEVKGVQGTFKADASVVLTARQAHDAVKHAEDGVDYWLYVVDSTETDHPRVFPIPWVRKPAQLRYGFYAKVWEQVAERPAVVTAEGVMGLTSNASET